MTTISEFSPHLLRLEAEEFQDDRQWHEAGLRELEPGLARERERLRTMSWPRYRLSQLLRHLALLAMRTVLHLERSAES
jgi:hypothetical protein